MARRVAQRAEQSAAEIVDRFEGLVEDGSVEESELTAFLRGAQAACELAGEALSERSADFLCDVAEALEAHDPEAER